MDICSLFMMVHEPYFGSIKVGTEHLEHVHTSLQKPSVMIHEARGLTQEELSFASPSDLKQGLKVRFSYIQMITFSSDYGTGWLHRNPSYSCL